jgi:hypothetical protein
MASVKHVLWWLVVMWMVEISHHLRCLKQPEDINIKFSFGNPIWVITTLLCLGTTILKAGMCSMQDTAQSHCEMNGSQRLCFLMLIKPLSSISFWPNKGCLSFWKCSAIYLQSYRLWTTHICSIIIPQQNHIKTTHQLRCDSNCMTFKNADMFSWGGTTK